VGKRSRKRRSDGDTLAPPPPPPVVATETDGAGLSRSEQRAEAARARLAPLAEGERPGAVTIGAVVALLLGLGNLGALIIGLKVRGETVSPGGVILLSAIFMAAGIGMWRTKYWAVLGFEALLAITVVFASLSLLFFNSWQGAAISLVTIGLAGTLFWKLIRAMARIQMPTYERPSRDV
jgi:hypothetical protein